MGKRTPEHIEHKVILLYHQGVPVSQIIEETGSKAVYAILRRHGHQPQRAPHGRDPDVLAVRQENCRNALVAAASQSNGPLRIDDYQAWRVTNPDAPDVLSIRKFLGGTWREVLAKAGVQAVESRAERNKLWAEADAVEWMREAASEDGVLTRERYDQWRKRQDNPTVESSFQIWQRFGWARLISAAGLRKRSGNTSIGD